MKNSFHVFSGINPLVQFLKSAEVLASAKNAQTMLFQIFSPQTDVEVLKSIIQTIKSEFSSALVIGATTIGGIINGAFSGAPVISVSFFETTVLKPIMFPCQNSCEYEVGVKLIKSIKNTGPDIAGVLIFATPLSIDITSVFKGMETEEFSFPVFGGGTGVYGSPQQSLIFCGDDFCTQGIFALVFHGGNLHIFAETFLGWQPLSREMTITEMDGNLVRKIDGAPAVHIYNHYLNLQNDSEFFKNVLDFPFLIERNGVTLARVPFFADENGGIGFLSDLWEGEKFHIGYSDPEATQQQLISLLNNISDFYPDVIFLFSCICRRYIDRSEESFETRAFDLVAPTVGFFTYGQFCGQQSGIFLNNASIVAVGLREGEIKQENLSRNGFPGKRPSFGSLPVPSENKIRSLIPKLLHFIKALSSELDRSKKELAKASGVDSLTHVYNREKAEEFLQNELNRGTRYKTNFSIILVEPENSKNETDSPEKSADRLILADLAGLIKKNIRRTDIVGRWDDEKLIIVLPETNLKQACKAAEKIRNLIISHSFPVTCSFGIASYEESDDKDSLLARAGNALAEAINCGGGKVGYTGIMD